MESTWVDFKAVKQAVPMKQLLDRYGVKLKQSGKELRGACPIHGGKDKDCFHANTVKNNFNCFAPACKAHGNVLDFVAAMERCSVREAALKLKDWFSVSGDPAPERGKPAAAKQESKTGSQLAPEKGGDREEPNKPLSFRLKDIDCSHPYLAQRGIDKETAEYFGVGFFPGKGSMAGRIVIPIENEQGDLVAYAGRSIDGSEPKYKVPAGFHKSQVLFNLPRALEEDSTGAVVLVEGFFDCMKVTQAEHVCVSLMGCSMSQEQEAQLVAHFKQVVIMLDGDEAGRSATGEIATRLARRLWVRVVDVGDGRQPDQLSTGELQALLGTV